MKQAHPLKSGSVAASSPARDRILALMLEQVDAIRAYEPGTRAGTDPEQLHKMRTAVRRLRAILGAAREMFDPEWLGGPRYIRLLHRLDNAIEHPAVVTAKLSLPAIAAGQFRKLRKAVKALPETPTNADLHAVRIKVKQARYAAELAQTMVGRPAKRFVARAKKVQDILGEHQDAVVAEERLRALVGRDGGRPERLLAGKLVTRQRARRHAAQTDFFEQWPKLKRRGDKAWTTE